MDEPVTIEFELADIAAERGSDATEYAALAPGRVAKLMFDFHETDGTPVGTESMWVEVTGIDGDDYIGVLRNDSIYADMRNGEPVEFEARHVIEIAT